MKLSTSLFLAFSLFSTLGLFAQKANNQNFTHTDTSIHSVSDFFNKSVWNGELRNHFMATINQGDLKDYWTNASGGSLKLETAQLKGFQLGIKGNFAYQTFSSDLNAVDTLVGKSAKWEKELYDVNAPTQTKDLLRLEALYLKFNFRSSFVQFGKIDLNTSPLFLARDSRMKPFVYQGFWSEIKEWKHQKVTLGWITGVSPRGMTTWYALNDAIGLNNNGSQLDGSKANYLGATNTKGIAVIGYENSLKNGLKIQYWNYAFHHLYDLNWFQLDYKHNNWLAGLQYAHQTAAAYQSTLSYENRYIQPEEKGQVLNAIAGYADKKTGFQASLAYLHSFDGGRFLYPRELGREDFYCSQPRSWVDGLGAADIWMLRLKYQPKTNNFWKNSSWDLRLSQTQIAEESSLNLNKYNVPNFYQATLAAKYKFKKALNGAEIIALYVTRQSKDSEILTAKETFYGTNYHHFSIITSIKF